MSAAKQDEHYREAIAQFGPALGRLVNGYERDTDLAQDLLQEIHLELWRSLARYEERCSLRTWVYRVAHNTATSHVLRQKRKKWDSMVALDEIADIQDSGDALREIEQRDMMQRMMALIAGLKPLDRQVILREHIADDVLQRAWVTQPTSVSRHRWRS
jgi:RNA polymerase sigma-70 factor, ECF subfamily